MKLKVLFVCLCFVKILYAQEKLIFSLDLIRHGDRTPTIMIPTVHYNWTEGIGELTAEGMQQEFNLGSKLRKKYVEEHHLLPVQYTAGTIEVYSTNFNRTLMSAQSFLLGLYPPGIGPKLSKNRNPALPYAFQPIPIRTAPDPNGLISNPTPEQDKDNFDKYVSVLPEYKEKTHQLQPKFKRWSKLTGMQIANLYDLHSLGDALYVYKLHNVPFPKGLSQKEIEEIIEIKEWIWTTAFKVKEVADLRGQKILVTIQNYLKEASLKQKPLKYVLLSGHDSTLASIMALLNLPLDERPPYAANVNFSLFETNGNAFVILSYNDIIQKIPACGMTQCPLEKFINI